MSRVITLSGGYQIALDSIPVTLSEPFVDLFGRLRVSAPETQVQIKQETSDIRENTLSYGVITAGVGLTGTAVENYFDIASTGGSGFYRARSKICGLYQNGKSILVLFTFNFLSTGTAGVIKRAGYFNGNDTSTRNGVWLEQNGTTVSWNLNSSLSGAVLDSEPQANWINNLTLDWTKAQIGFIAFEYLGVGDIMVGFVQDRQILPSYIFSNKNAIEKPYMATPNLFLTYELEVNRVTTNEEKLRVLCASCLIEGGQERNGFPFSISRFTGLTLPSNTRVAVMVFRLNNPNTRVLVTEFGAAVNTNTVIQVELFRLDSVGNLPASNGVINAVESWIPTNTNVTFSGRSLSGSFAGQTRIGSGNLLVNQYLESNFNDTGVYYALVVTASANNTSFQASLVNFILET